MIGRDEISTASLAAALVGAAAAATAAAYLWARALGGGAAPELPPPSVPSFDRIVVPAVVDLDRREDNAAERPGEESTGGTEGVSASAAPRLDVRLRPAGGGGESPNRPVGSPSAPGPAPGGPPPSAGPCAAPGAASCAAPGDEPARGSAGADPDLESRSRRFPAGRGPGSRLAPAGDEPARRLGRRNHELQPAEAAEAGQARKSEAGEGEACALRRARR